MDLRLHSILLATALLFIAGCGDDERGSSSSGADGSTTSGMNTAPTPEEACATYCDKQRQCDTVDSTCEDICEAQVNDVNDRVDPEACRRTQATAIHCLGMASCVENMIDTDDPQHPCYAEFQALDCAYPTAGGGGPP